MGKNGRPGATLDDYLYWQERLENRVAISPVLSDELLPDRWAAAHPEAILNHRLYESRVKAARTRSRRAHRRACQQ